MQLLCIHTDKHSIVNSYIRTDESTISSGHQLKILGFYFDNNPNAVCHVTKVIEAFYSKLWTLRFLRRSGMAPMELLKVYFTVIRAAVEYASVVYHSLIPKYLSDRLERIQNQAMKIIFGNSVDYDRLVEEGIIQTLESRRDAACIDFANKAVANPSFGDKWFCSGPEATTE